MLSLNSVLLGRIGPRMRRAGGRAEEERERWMESGERELERDGGRVARGRVKITSRGIDGRNEIYSREAGSICNIL